MALRRVPIHRVSNRPNLFMGGDRELVMFSGLLAATLVICTFSWPSVVFGIALWFACVALLRKLAKSDPKMRFVYIRHRQYRKYYPAHATPFRINQNNQSSAFSKNARRYK
jgi:type IV secretory pathway TrbD component